MSVLGALFLHKKGFKIRCDENIKEALGLEKSTERELERVLAKGRVCNQDVANVAPDLVWTEPSLAHFFMFALLLCHFLIFCHSVKTVDTY